MRLGKVFWATSVAVANRRSERRSLGRCTPNCRSVFVMTLCKISINQCPIIIFEEWYLLNLFHFIVSMH